MNRIVLAACTVLAACSFFEDAPPEKAASLAVERQIETQSKDIKVAFFKKTDGQSRIDQGVKYYKYEYAGVVEFAKDSMWSFKGGFETTEPLPAKASRRERKRAKSRLAGKKLAKKGDKLKIRGVVEFQSKESGWVVDSVDLELDE